MRRPKVFLFDERLSNLDAALRTQTTSEIKKLHQKLRATFIYVTHDQAEAMTLSDRVVVMNAGSIQQVGAPREVYDAPANLFVATFFGSPRINIVYAQTLGLPHEPDVKLGIRSEHVEVGLGAPPQGAVAGRVYLVEPMGSESWVTVDVGNEKVIARAAAEFNAADEAPVWIRPDVRRIHRFEAQSGLRR